MNTNLLQFLGVILAAFLGSALSGYFSHWKYRKDTLYQKKVDTYIELGDALLNLDRYCLPTNHHEAIILAFFNLVEKLNRCYLFMPKELSESFKDYIGDPMAAFRKLTNLTEGECSYIFSVDPSRKIGPSNFNSQISIALVKAFSPITSKIPKMGDQLKKDLGIP